MVFLRRKACRAFVIGFLLASDLLCSFALADKVTLKDGRVLEGRFAKLAGVAINPLDPSTSKGPVDVKLILMCDNELTRTMVSTRQVQPGSVAADAMVIERIKIDQPVAQSAPRIAAVGPMMDQTEFDEFGRRVYTMFTGKGPIDVIQGITEVTPQWVKVEALKGEKSYVWDMRIATSSIPRETLNKILHKYVDKGNKEHRLRIVRLYLQSERYQDAEAELKQVIADFPDQSGLETVVQEVAALSSGRLLKELDLRREGGQHRMVYQLLQQFPTENVADATLVQVRQKLEEYAAAQKKAAELLALLKKNLDAVEDSDLRERLRPVCDEITRDLYFSTMDRMASFERLASETLKPEQNVALAISGWLLGADSAVDNAKLANSLVTIRQHVHDYMNETTKGRRDEILTTLSTEEGFNVEMVADMIAHMKPPLDTDPSPTGSYELTVPGAEGEPDVVYYVQLPPEYDPYKRYPTVVTLNGAATTPQQQIDWWAGAVGPKGSRLGQASRHGYIVIAPTWSKPHQRQAEFSINEHAAVLNSLRDACRRFSIDTDKVFLSGHSMGGDAAWVLGLSHPDLWAGVIPIVARSENVVAQYWPNAKNLPFYFVGGELDGDKIVANSRDLDRYLNKGYDTTVVEYLGRGHDHFSDDILRIFDWMGRKQRIFFPKEFDAVTMRPWDNFFWWIEVNQHPPKAVTATWPPPAGTRPLQIDAKVNATGGINVRAGAGRVTIWLTPDLVDFKRPFNVIVNGRKLNSGQNSIAPDLSVLLEDVRTRGDRLHPFWAKVE